jgi:hypothetical protein
MYYLFINDYTDSTRSFGEKMVSTWLVLRPFQFDLFLQDFRIKKSSKARRLFDTISGIYNPCMVQHSMSQKSFSMAVGF